MKAVSLVYPRAHCRGCNQIVKYEVREMPATEGSPGNAQDIVCPECSYVIATFHE